MPTRMMQGHRLDVRADPFDFRDREYRPQLVQLPGQFPGDRWLEAILPVYARRHVRDQGGDGACTGFALAAVIGYLLFAERYRNLNSDDPLEDEGPEHERISPWMLYRLARLYDEWDGEEYSGSSCRGAMKGWHKHGACLDAFWSGKRSDLDSDIWDTDVWLDVRRHRAWHVPAPVPEWQQDAVRRPLGAYYRVDRCSVRDIQSAIHQVGAVFASARVHRGWSRLMHQTRSPQWERPAGGTRFPVIAADRPTGGHAFALVGYNKTGFLIQNSWGPAWGHGGFAVLPYEDWSANGMDAWVAVLGAPVSRASTVEARFEAADAFPRTEFARGGYRLGRGESLITVNTQPLRSPVLSPRETADTHAEDDEPAEEDFDGPLLRVADPSWVNVVTLAAGNEGRAIRQDINDLKVEDQYRWRSFLRPRAVFESGSPRRLVVYFHGGLNDEETADRRTRVMAPAFDGNGVYPLFYRWKTGLRETLRHIAEDVYRDTFGDRAESLRGFTDRFRGEAEERIDRFVETFCRSGPPKSLWGEMKENAEKAAGPGYASALVLLAENLSELQDDFPELDIHLVGHSAGAFAAGHLLKLLTGRPSGALVRTLTLWAPACSLAFACETFLPALEDDVLDCLHVDVLTDKLEREDDVAGVYHKSLLSLISRALDDRHKEPILGLQHVWTDLEHARRGEGDDRHDRWAADPRRRGQTYDPSIELKLPSEFDSFAEVWNDLNDRVTWQAHKGPAVLEESIDGQPVQTAPRTHGSFDNDVRIFNHLLQRLTGEEPPDIPVGRLHF